MYLQSMLEKLQQNYYLNQENRDNTQEQIDKLFN